MTLDYRRTMTLDPGAARNGVDEQTVRCRALVVAFVAQNLQDYKSNQLSAIEWVKRQDNKPFGFQWCCDVLDLNAERVRAQLVRRA